MPSPTLTPTGELGKSLLGLAWLIASSSTFQDLVGAVDADAALAFVHVEADDTDDSISQRPRAIVEFERQYDRQKTALVDFNSMGALLVSFEFPPSEKYAANLWDELLEFCNRIDAIKAECQVLAGTSTGYFANETHFNSDSWELVAGPCPFHETKAAAAGEVSEYVYGALFKVNWKG